MHTLENLPDHLIKAGAVNHNTSAYMELMARSLLARHTQDSGLHFSLQIFDNDSQDDMTDLKSYAESKGIPIAHSDFSTDSRHNSHGEVLSRFVLENPEPSHYLFLDSDVVFFGRPNAYQHAGRVGEYAECFWHWCSHVIGRD